MKILITGGTGFIGTVLCDKLLEAGHQIVVLSRNIGSLSSSLKGIENLSQLADDESFDVVINLAGEPIAEKRWSSLQKEKIIRSRLEITQELIDYFERIARKPQVFISGSAIGYYGIQATDEEISEAASGDNSFSSQLCQQWEGSAKKAEALGIRTCILRTGIVLGKRGGALKKMIPPFKLGLGGKIGSGKQWMPWIHINDMVGIINYCIDQETISGAVNCTAPCPVTNSEFTHILGKALNRPTFFNMPAIAVTLLFGDMGKELLLSGKSVCPVKLQQSNYPFQFSRLESALSDIFTH